MGSGQAQRTVIAGSSPYLELDNQGHVISIALKGDRLTLGRAPDVALQLPQDWLSLSRYHATLIRNGSDYDLYDGITKDGVVHRSSNGLFVGHTRVGISEGYSLKSGVELQIGQDPSTLIRLKYFNPSCPQSIYSIQSKSASINLQNCSVLLGRDPSSTLVLDAPVVSRKHAVIDSDSDGRYVLHDCSANGVFINGQKVHRSTYLEEGCVIRIGPFVLIFRGNLLILQDRGSQLRVDAFNVTRTISTRHGSQYLLHCVSFPLEPGQLIAIVGGSGTGKSTLLRTLLGIEPLTEGHVRLNGEDLRNNFHMYRTQIGYVPQDDIVHRNLTVEQVLTFAARLRLPPDTDVAAAIGRTLEEVELSDRRHTLVGQLSGGQRKRVSIGVELLANPKLFFLDEPTSGLDPGLDKKMMQLLQQLADKEERTVAIVTHATANIALCDRIAFMGRGGNLCYFGPPKTAPSFFDAGADDFADIYNELERSPNGKSVEEHCRQWADRFEQHPIYQKYVRNQLIVPGENSLYTPVPSSNSINPSPWQQLSVLLRRDIQLLLADRFNLMLSLLTAPIGISLITLAVRNPNALALGDDLDPTLAPLALRILFVFTCAAIWVGLSGALQTIVKESGIYARERLVNLGILPYIGSKSITIALLALVQTLFMTSIILLGFQSPESKLLPWSLGVSITTFLTLVTNGYLGLMVSCFVRNETQANTALPLLMLPQIIFSGVLFEMRGAVRFLSWLMLSRWSVGAYGTLVDINAMVPEPIQYPDGSTVPQPFEITPVYEPTWENVTINWVMLGVHSIVYVALALWRQKQKDIL